MQDETFVLIAGGGPVGLSAAIELAWRNVPFVLVNDNAETATHPKCNNTNARSMEHFRRLGIAKELRVITAGVLRRQSDPRPAVAATSN